MKFTEKTAIVLFNLGGPDKPESVKPFLFNLFSDKNIITVPQPMRYLIAKLISSKREKEAQEIYHHLGGGSPLLANTQAQAQALAAKLDDPQTKIFVAMRYWHPRADVVVEEVKQWNPAKIILMPLYPQFSTTTTHSSFEEWEKLAKKAGLNQPTQLICCYPAEELLVASHVAKLVPALQEAAKAGPVRLLFSAHGLPKKIVDSGDPYQWQVEQSAKAVSQALRGREDVPDFESVVTYQSRVGPLEWIGPSTDLEIEKAGEEKRALVICPIAFVSDHSETLVEIEIQYRELAMSKGCAAFFRVDALGTEPNYIMALADMISKTANQPKICAAHGQRICPSAHKRCAMASMEQ